MNELEIRLARHPEDKKVYYSPRLEGFYMNPPRPDVLLRNSVLLNRVAHATVARRSTIYHVTEILCTAVSCPREAHILIPQNYLDLAVGATILLLLIATFRLLGRRLLGQSYSWQLGRRGVSSCWQLGSVASSRCAARVYRPSLEGQR